jgi:hypothetical protein
MTMWERARRARHCGYCRGEIAAGDPILVIRFDASTRHDKIRCQACAGQAPPDLPEVIDRREELVQRVARLSQAAPLDVKQRQSREPGEEG